MGNFNFSVGELTSQIKKMGRMNLAHLGSSNATTGLPSEQDQYIWYYMTLAMWKYAGLVYRKRTSQPLTVTENGYVTFKIDNADVEDFYAPIRMFKDSDLGQSFPKRTSFEAPNPGWYKETANDQFHIRGPGTYVLLYRAYPPKVSSAGQTLDWPSASYDLLMYETIGKIKESLNDLEGAAQAYGIADKLIPVLIKANMDNSQSTSGGAVPSQNEAQYYRR